MPFSLALSLTVLVSIGSFALGSRWYLRNGKKLKLNYQVLVTSFWGLVIAVLLLECICFSQNPSDVLPVRCILAGLLGVCTGWIVGIWITPLSRSESTTFGKYWTAIGVGSGFTLKWAIDQVREPNHLAWLRANWLVAVVFAIAGLMTLAAAYNARAYNNSLDVFLRDEPGNEDVTAKDPVTIRTSGKASFYACVSGPSDPDCRWIVVPDNPGDVGFGSVDEHGLFTAGTIQGEGRIIAFNLEDPTLSNFITVKVAVPAQQHPALQKDGGGKTAAAVPDPNQRQTMPDGAKAA